MAFLAACALPGDKPAPPPAQAPQPLPPLAAPPLTDVKPEYAESAQVMYRLLLGEIAGQKGELELSVDAYLEATRLSDDPEIAERATRLASFARDYGKAVQAAERWAELTPTSLDAQQSLLILYLRSGQQDKALQAAETVLRLTAKRPFQGYGHLVALLSNEQNEEAVDQLMQMIVGRNQDNPYAQYAYASLSLQMKNDKAARVHAEKALKLKPDFDEAQSLLARILMVQGETEKALQVMQKLVQAHPDSIAHRTTYARLLAIAKRYDKAQHEFEQILAKHPDNADILYAVGLLTLEQRKYQEAEAYFRRLLQAGRHVHEAYYYLGNIAEARKQYEQAIGWYRNVQSGTNRINAHLRVAQLLAKMGEIKAAREHIYQLREEDRGMAVRLLVAEVEILTSARQYEEAMQVANEALTQNPDHVDLLYARSLLAEKMGRLDITENDLRAILNKEPENAHALNALGYTLADRTQRFAEAHELIQRAIKIMPDEPAILDSMGWVLYRMGRYADAIKYLKRALELLPDDEIAAHLGEVLWVNGQHEEANAIWQRALKDEPDSEHIHDVLQRLKKQ